MARAVPADDGSQEPRNSLGFRPRVEAFRVSGFRG